jgi:hypothetical protein
VSQLFDSLAVFGDLTDEVLQKSKYAKWRAAYISKCIKNGDAPLPPETEESDNQPEESDHLSQPTSSLTNFAHDLSNNLPTNLPNAFDASSVSHYNQPEAATSFKAMGTQLTVCLI